MNKFLIPQLYIVVSLILVSTDESAAQNTFSVSNLPSADLIRRTNDKGYMILSDGLVTKLDSLKNLQWQRRVLDAWYQFPDTKGDLIEHPSGYYYAEVYEWEPAIGNIYTLHGFDIIPLRYNGDIANNMAIFYHVDNNIFDTGHKLSSINVNKFTGDYLITGSYYYKDINTNTIIDETSFTKKYDSLHNEVWGIEANITQAGLPRFTDSKDLYYSGGNYETLVLGHHFAMKLDSSSNIIWQRSYTDFCNGKIVQDDSSVFVFLHANQSFPFNAEVRKMDYNGNIIFNKTIVGIKVAHAQKVAPNMLLISGHLLINQKRVIIHSDTSLNIIKALQIDSIPYGYCNDCISIDESDTSFLSATDYYLLSVGVFKKHFLDTLCGATPVTINVSNSSYSSQSTSYVFSSSTEIPNLYPYPNYTWSSQVSHWGCQPFVSTSTFSLSHSSLSIAPNPASDFFEIKNEFKKGDLVQIKDIPGKVLRTITVTKNVDALRIESSNIKSGTYLIQIITGSKVFLDKIVIKQ